MIHKSLAALAAFFFFGLTIHTASAQDIVVGQVAPLSGSAATTGDDYAAGAAAYFASVNAQGGIGGRKIRVVLRDDGHTPARTVAVAKALLVEDRPVALFGFVGSANVEAVQRQKLLDDESIALVAPFAASHELREGGSPNIFYIRPSYAQEAEYLVQQLHMQGLRRIAVFYQNDAFGKAAFESARKAVADLNLLLVATGTYDAAKPDDVAVAASGIDVASPDAVIMVSVNAASTAFIQAMRKNKSKARLFMLSVANLKHPLASGSTEALLHGVSVSQVMPDPMSPRVPVAREFRDAMARFQPNKPLTYTGIESFIAAKVLVAAIHRSGAKPTRQSVLDQLAGLRRYDVGGFEIDFAPDKRVGSKFVDVTMIGKDGRIVR